jgi:predicted dehydrogenase
MIGYGGIGHAHAEGYRILAERGAPVRLVAVLDINPAKFTGTVEINTGTGASELPCGAKAYTSLDEMVAAEDFDMVDICLPTYLHKDYAIKFLDMGKHVLSEKPMALSSADCEEMIAAAKRNDRRLMIGQCLRFNSRYECLKECTDGRYGKLTRLMMHRLSLMPDWGFENWFADHARSGGCILDMHIHDVDMARYLLGEPKAVTCWSENAGVMDDQVQHSHLFYDGCHVTIDGSWNELKGTPFAVGYRARFERAELVLVGNTVTLYEEGKSPVTLELPAKNHMAEEIDFLAHLILDPTAVNEKNPPESAAATVRLIEKLRESARRGSERITL